MALLKKCIECCSSLFLKSVVLPFRKIHLMVIMLISFTMSISAPFMVSALVSNGESGSSISKKATNHLHRRHFLQSTTTSLTFGIAIATPTVANAATKSRTEGYAVQHSEREWAYMLSGAQYNILRRGGTERQKSSILNEFTSTSNVGTYVCAGCDTPLFSSQDKFSSGTGWPSFAAALDGGVEVENLDPIRATLNGREVRCGTCGGHLGDLFNDGVIFVGTAAAKTGKRYCIDGAAMIFKPQDGGEDIMGDRPPPNKVIQYEPSMYR